MLLSKKDVVCCRECRFLEENLAHFCKVFASMQCQLHLLAMSSCVEDRIHVASLRLPDDFNYCFSEDDRFEVTFDEDVREQECI